MVFSLQDVQAENAELKKAHEEYVVYFQTLQKTYSLPPSENYAVVLIDGNCMLVRFWLSDRYLILL
jgi:hypothetical protein